MEQPQGFVIKGEEEKMYKLEKVLYRLKQAPKAWYSQIDSYFIKQGFEKSKSESTLYVKHQGKVHVLIVTFHVNDLVYIRSDKRMMKKFKTKIMNA